GADGRHGRHAAEIGRRVAVRAADLDEHVAGGVDAIERRRGGAGSVIRVANLDDAAGRVQGRVRLNAGRIGVAVDDGTGVRVDAHVLAGVADDANAVGDRVEGEAERGAVQWHGERAGADQRGGAAGRIDDVEPVGTAQAVELTGPRPE